MARRDLTGAVDFAHLATYTMGDPGLTEEVLGLFRQQAELWLPLLDPDGPGEAWRDAAHSLKGSALGIGAFAVADACAEAERDASSPSGERRRRLEAIRVALDAALHDIAAFLHEEALRGLKTPR